MKTLGLVLKVTEACNCKCKYCYYFNGYEECRTNPRSIDLDTISKICDFLNHGIKDLAIDCLQIDFHGGEPLMLGCEKFDAICHMFANKLAKVNVSFCLQTNGTLVSEKWIKLFSKHKISVGISLDGPKEYHNLNRHYASDRGTYDEVIRGLKLLINAAKQDRIESPALLCVIDPRNDITRIYNHFSKDFGIKFMDFILPDLNYNTKPDTFSAEIYGDILCSLFNKWAKDDDPSIDIRILKNVLQLLLYKRSYLMDFGCNIPDYFTITVSPDGELAPDDSLRSCGKEFVDLGYSIYNSTLKKFTEEIITPLLRKQLPEECTNCCWAEICVGGSLVHRYDSKLRFARKSIYCDTLKKMYAHATRYLLSRGVTMDKIRKNLNI